MKKKLPLIFASILVSFTVFGLEMSISGQTTLDTSTFIGQIKNGESFVITFARSGCFSKKDEWKILKIERKKDNYFAVYNGASKILSSEDIVLVKNFEVKLKSINEVYKCTNNDQYVFTYNKRKRIFFDNTCSWHGFNELTEKLFN